MSLSKPVTTSEFCKRPDAKRIPNAYLIFYLEQKDLHKESPIPALSLKEFISKQWKSMSEEEQQVYYDKYNALKNLDDDNCESNSTTYKKNMVVKREQKDDSWVVIGASNTDPETNADACMQATDEYVPANETISHKVVSPQKSKDLRLQSATETVATSSFAKRKTPKRSPRCPNPFMLYVKHNKKNLDPAFMVDGKHHFIQVLGRMWAALPDSEKEKYREESRNMKTPDVPAPTKPLKNRPIKIALKRVPKKTAPRKAKGKAKAQLGGQSTDVVDQDDGVNEKIPEMKPNTSKPLDKQESNKISEVPSGPQISAVRPSAVSQFYQTPTPAESHARSCCYRPSAYANCMGDFCPMPDGGLSRLWSSPGCSSPFFSANPFNAAALCMYQLAMTPQLFRPPCSQMHCNCSFPYTYNNPLYPIYGGMYPGRSNSTFSWYGGPQGVSSVITDTRDDAAEESRGTDNTDSDLLIVDDNASEDKGTEKRD